MGSDDKWAKTSSYACWASAVLTLEPNHLMGGQSIFGPKKWASTFSPPSPWLTCGEARASKEEKIVALSSSLNWWVFLKKWDFIFVGFVGE